VDESDSTIRFDVECSDAAFGKSGSSFVITLPEKASATLPNERAFAVEGTINGFPFRSALEKNSDGIYFLIMTQALREAAEIIGLTTALIEITRIADEPEVRRPIELIEALAAAPRAQAMWMKTTPIARRDWVLWIVSGKQAKTRLGRIQKACSMLASGKRRVCCFGGLKWLTKDHPSVETWLFH
jgi:hypothetical protein